MDKTISTTGCIIIMAAYLSQMFYICDPLNLLPLTAALWTGVCMWRRAIRLTAIDLCLIGIWLYGAAGPTVNPTAAPWQPPR